MLFFLPTLGINLTETWRWEDSTSLTDLPGLDGGVVSKNDGDLFVVGSSSVVSGLSDGSSFSETSARFSVSKINGETGNDMWLYEGGTESGIDRAFGVGVDAKGDVIVAGSTTGNWDPTVNASGLQTFAAFKLDGNNNTIIWQYQSENNQGTAATSTSEGVAETGGKIMSLAVDSEGDALFVGHIWDISGEEDDHVSDSNYTIGKLSGTTGEEIWVYNGGLPGSFEALWACDVDSNDNIVAAGLTGFTATENGSDYLVVKYSADGKELWKWDNGTQLNETLLAVVVDDNDDVYVAGGKGINSIDSPIACESIVIKLDGGTGKEIWRYQDSLSGFTGGNILRGIAVNSGIVIAVGVGDPSDDDSAHFSYSSADDYGFAAILLNATDGENAGSWMGSPLQDDVYFALFDSEGALFLGGHSADEGSDFALTKFQEISQMAAAGPPWLLISLLTSAAIIVVFVALSIYIACRVRRRKVYLSKTVEDFGPVFRPGANTLGALPSTVATSREGPPSQYRSNRSVNSSIMKDFRIRNTKEISQRTTWTANLFASTPDPPKEFAPKSPPEQETPEHADEVVTSPTVSPTVASVSIDVISFPGYISSSPLKKEELQPRTYMPPPPYFSLVPSINSGKINGVVQRKQQSTGHRRNDSAAGSETDVVNQPMDETPELGVLDTAARVSINDDPKDGSRRDRGNEYCPSVEAKSILCRSPFLGTFLTSPVTTEATIRKHNLEPDQRKFTAAPAPVRDSSPRVSRLVNQDGRTDSDSASIFGGASERAIASSPHVLSKETNRSGAVVHIPYPLRRDRYGRTEMNGGNLSAASRLPYFKRSFTSVDSRQDEIRRENLHRVESWVTKATVFPKEVHKRYSS